MSRPTWKKYGGLGPDGQGYSTMVGAVLVVAWPVENGWRAARDDRTVSDYGRSRAEAFANLLASQFPKGRQPRGESRPLARPLAGLLAARQAARLSQRDLGALIGKNQGHLGKIERGTVALEVRDALTLARALGVTVEYLVTGADESRDMIENLAKECERGARFIRSYDGKPDEIRAWAARCESMKAAGASPVCTPAIVLERAATEARQFLTAPA